MKVMIFSYFRD